MAFITPIVDRTAEDVLYAMQNQNSTSNLKGAWNISDVNRIIQNVNHLKTLLESEGYSITIIPQSNFVMADLPYVNSKIDILRNNVNAIVNAFHKLNNPSIRYGNILDYTDANTLELNLQITNNLLEGLISSYRYCGTFICGQPRL